MMATTASFRHFATVPPALWPGLREGNEAGNWNAEKEPTSSAFDYLRFLIPEAINSFVSVKKET